MIRNYLVKTYQFNLKGAFGAIDDWNASWIDSNNLKRFLQNMGYQAKKPLKTPEVIKATIRRLDM